jgi:BASS family bile acid:Na+ symporter
VVFALGLRATFADATFLFRTLLQQPHRLLRAIGAMYFVVPVIVIAIALAFDLPQPVEIAMVAMAVSPVPPLLPGKQLRFGGDEGPVFGLLVAMSLASILAVPVAVEVLSAIFRREVHIAPSVIAQVIATSVLAPLLAGMLVRRFAPAFATRFGQRVSRLGNLLLIVAAAAILWHAWPAIWSLLGSGAILAFLGVAIVALVVGHLMGGPTYDDRTVLAIAATMRHPGVALAVAQVAVPEQRLAPAAILLSLLVGVVVTSLYGSLRQRGRGATTPSTRPR